MSEGAIISLDPRASAKVKRPRLVRTHAPKSRLRCILPILRFRLRQASGERRPIFITHLGDELFTLTNVTRPLRQPAARSRNRQTLREPR